MLLTFDASVVGVGLEPSRAELALGQVVLNQAGGPVGARQTLAGVSALELDAGHVRGAPLILEADADFGAAGLVALANGSMVCHPAFLSWRAGRGSARVLAGARDASLADGAFRARLPSWTLMLDEL